MPLYEIDVLVTFRNKYIIEADALEHAFDELVMTEHNREFEEISQKFLGEQIIDGRETTIEGVKETINRLKEDKHELCSYWMEDKLIHKIDYTK
jgi:NAD(P)H-hydrate repair Nnr-like enzyme with NAD(P)H-hydrate dehydratase domain